MASKHILHEDELTSLLVQGDERGLRQAIKDYLHPLRYYAWTFVKNKELAEEIAYDAFFKLWQRHAHFESNIQIKRFLYLVTKNSCLDHLKTADNRYRQSLDENEITAAADIDLEARLIQTELIQAIYQEIDKLPEKQAAVFRLSFLEGMKPEEISIALGISLNAVYLNKSLATKSLQKIFRTKGDWLYVLFLFTFRGF